MKYLISVFAILLSIQINAQNTPREIVDQFFNIYQGDPAGAVDYLFSTNELMTQSNDQIETVKYQLTSAIEQLGQYFGYILVNEKSIDNTITSYDFLVKYNNLPLRFNFVFYKASKEWRINNFNFDDNIGEMLY